MSLLVRIGVLIGLFANTLAWTLLFHYLLLSLASGYLNGPAATFVVLQLVPLCIAIVVTLLLGRMAFGAHRPSSSISASAAMPATRIAHPAAQPSQVYCHSFHGDPTLAGLCEDPLTERNIGVLTRNTTLCVSSSHSEPGARSSQ